jgi:hypothetical protein
MIRTTALFLAFAGICHAADIRLPNPGFESGGTDHAEGWGSFEFGDEGAVSRLKPSKDARTGKRAFEISVHGGGGGQGIYLDVPTASLNLREGDTVSFSIHMKSKHGKPLIGASLGMHMEFMDGSEAGSKILARTDTLGTSGFVGGTLSDKFRKYTTSHTLRHSEMPGGLSAVKAMRLVIVALQPEDRKPFERLGTAIVDDASAELKRRAD